MASIESLPPDQRAVLQLVLQRGRSYDDIAGLLSIDRIAVRQRAHAALDALGPGTRLDADQRAQITDYLLGQQTDADASATRDRLASSAGERAWARVVASELAPLASGNLPEIPAEGAREEPPAAPTEPVAAPTEPVAAPAEPAEPAETAEPPAPAESRATRRERRRRPQPEPEPAVAFGASSDDPDDGDRPVSRRGGAALIGIGAVIVIVVVVILISSGGGSSKNATSTTNANAGSTTAPATTPTGSTGTTGSTGSTGSTGTTGTTGAKTQVLARFNLTSPTSKTAVGIAELLRAGSQLGIAVVGEHIPANTKANAYAVWLYNSPGHAELLGFVNPGVTSTEQLSTAGPLPANASQYHQLLVTIETQQKPKQPGTIVLEGQVKLTS
jgi:outer membrane biosynthesis protein TonB